MVYLDANIRLAIKIIGKSVDIDYIGIVRPMHLSQSIGIGIALRCEITVSNRVYCHCQTNQTRLCSFTEIAKAHLSYGYGDLPVSLPLHC